MNIVFQGDSITDASRGEGYGQGYAMLVSGILGEEEAGQHAFYNRGVGGNRVVDMYARIKKDCLNLEPDVLSVLIGVNDVWHELGDSNGVAAGKFEKIYDMFINEVTEHNPNVKIIIFGAYVVRGAATIENWDYFRKEVDLRAAAAKRIAEKYSKNCTYIPLQEVFDEAIKRAPEEQWSRDGVHPTPQGHMLIAKEWIKAYKAFK